MTGRIISTRPLEGVVLLEIDNPPVNSLGGALRAEFETELDRTAADLTVRAIVLTGRDRAFCAGDDLREERGEGARASLAQFGRLLDKIEAHRVPVIAAINGHAVGGGLELALSCDIRIAARDASFLAAGVNVGLMASVFRLPRLIGAGRASTMILTGAPVKADRALEWGLLTDTYAPEALLPAALDLAHRIATRAPLSVEASKRMIRQALDLTSETWAAASAGELSVLMKSEDHKAGVRAMLERKPPVFTRT